MQETKQLNLPDRGHSMRDERAEEYFIWKGARTAKDFISYVKNVRGNKKLSHSGILKDAGISESLARSNPDIKQDLLDMEKQLREQGHLQQAAEQAAAGSTPNSMPIKQGRSFSDKKRIEQLEQELASVRVERDDLKEALKRYKMLDQYLSDTMRLPR
jgi:hypothetical protein